MKSIPHWLSAVVGLAVAGAAKAGVLVFAVGSAVPDANPSGLADVRTVAGLPTSLAALRVRLEIAGIAPGGMINGDLYATLAYEQVPGTIDAFSVLLNRVGKMAGNPDGYLDDGLSVTLAPGAADIHTYRTILGGGGVPLAGALGGTWSPDARWVDPAVVLDTTPRTAGLEGFQNLNPNGRWTLFVADLAAGGDARLVSWALEYELVAVPEPGAWAALSGLGLVAWAALRRRGGC